MCVTFVIGSFIVHTIATHCLEKRFFVVTCYMSTETQSTAYSVSHSFAFRRLKGA